MNANAATRLVLIDGSSYLFRAFHALPPLTSAQGEPTGALFGVVNMLRAVLKERPHRVAFVLDASGPTFRNELYPAYKANRPPMPEELRAQVEPMIEIVRALGLPLLRVAGVEADDVIGTLARQGLGSAMEVTISTSDKDFAQLVEPGITLVNTMTGNVLDRERVIEKFGVPPERIVDYLALVGDTVDNIPGVVKCGPKTAAKWLAEFGDLDGVMAGAAAMGGKIGENLRDALGTLPLARELATIRTDVELPQTLDSLTLGGRDIDALRVLFARFGFTQSLRELESGAAGAGEATDLAGAIDPTADAAAGINAANTGAAEIASVDRERYVTILERAQFEAWVDKLAAADLWAFDTETTSIDAQRAEIVGVSFATSENEAAYVPLAHDYPGAPPQLRREAVLARLKPLLEDAGQRKVAQHGKYDINVLAHYGIEVRGVAFDTMLESFVLNAGANRHDMDTLAARHLGHRTIAYHEVAGKGARQIPFSEVAIDDATRYAAEDADVTLRLHHALWPQLSALAGPRFVFEKIEMPLVPVLARMERTGVLIDGAMLAAQTRVMRKRMTELIAAAHEVAGHPFSLDSPKQLQTVLFERLGLPITQKTPSGQPSTNEEALAEIAELHALPRLILDYRMLAKLVSTYTEKLPAAINPRTGRVHTSYHQAGAATGRLASSDPNLQNIPIKSEEGRRIRQAFVAPPGFVLIAADYSQIELRIMAHLSGDTGLLAAFRDGIDVHRATAAEVFDVEASAVDANQRRAAKAINFGLMYGMGAHGLARQIGIERKLAQEYMDRYFGRYPGVRDFMAATRERARRDGYVETVFGRRLHLDSIRSRNASARAGAERAAINAPMQGTAADIIKRAMIEVDAWLDPKDPTAPKARMLMQVHDELVLEVAEGSVDEVREGLRARMMAAASLRVPLDVDVGTGLNWQEAH